MPGPARSAFLSRTRVLMRCSPWQTESSVGTRSPNGLLEFSDKPGSVKRVTGEREGRAERIVELSCALVRRLYESSNVQLPASHYRMEKCEGASEADLLR